MGPIMTPDETYPSVPSPIVVLTRLAFNDKLLIYPDVAKPVTVLGKKTCAELGYKRLMATAVENNSPDKVLI
jgi:hypothetical protein